MNILQIIPHYLPAERYGGPLRVAHSLSKEFSNNGHQVIVLTTNLAGPNQALDVLTDEPIKLQDITVYYEPTILSQYWGFSPRLFWRAMQKMKWADVVLVHAHYQFVNWAGAWLARKTQTPYVIFAHGSLHRRGIAHKSKLRKRLYLRLFENRNLKDALFIAFNAKEEQHNSLYATNGKIIPSGIDPTEFRNLPPKGQFRHRYPQLQGKTCFLFLGRLDIKHKGLDLLIPAFSEINRDFENLHLVLAGPDEDGGKDKITQQAQVHGLRDLSFTGMLSGQEKLAALQDADVFVLPSRFEGLSIALLEALYMGLPVLVTDQIGLSERVEQIGAGISVEAAREPIQQGLRQFIDPHRRNQMSGRGTQMIQARYTWSAISQQLLEEIAYELSVDEA